MAWLCDGGRDIWRDELGLVKCGRSASSEGSGGGNHTSLVATPRCVTTVGVGGFVVLVGVGSVVGSLTVAGYCAVFIWTRRDNTPSSITHLVDG